MESIPEISSVKEFTSPSHKTFTWIAQKNSLLATGSVSIDSQKPDDIVLELETGSMNSFKPENIEYGKTILDKIYENLRANCPNIPPASSLKERCIRVCD